jgi:hypothetical protein
MRITLKIFLFLILVICFSCEEQPFFVQCSDCTVDEPLRTDLEVKLESGNYSEALIRFYEGNIEDSILIGSYRSFSSSFNLDVYINKKYSVTATYYIVNKKYIAVDSATPRVKYEKELCENLCYFIYNRVIDLRLKKIH